MRDIAKLLREKGVNVFLDEGGLTGGVDMLCQLEATILSSTVFVCFETVQYRRKVNLSEMEEYQEYTSKQKRNYCKLEFYLAAEQQNKPMVCVDTISDDDIFSLTNLLQLLQRSFQDKFVVNAFHEPTEIDDAKNAIVNFLYGVYLKSYDGYEIVCIRPLRLKAKYHSSACSVLRSQGKVHCCCGNVSSQYHFLEVGETPVPFHSFDQPDSWGAGIIARSHSDRSNEGDLPIQQILVRLQSYFNQFVSAFITSSCPHSFIL